MEPANKGRIRTCEKHLLEPCDGGHRGTRLSCTYCKPLQLPLTDGCLYCLNLPEHRVPGPPLLDYELVKATLYFGIRRVPPGGKHVYFRRDDGMKFTEREELPQRDDLWDGGGFEWGYGGAGPSSLALALLAHVTGDGPYGMAQRHKFKAQVVAKFRHDTGWNLKGAEILEWVLRNPISLETRFGSLPTDEQHRYIDMDIIEGTPCEHCGGAQEWAAPNTARCTECGLTTEF